ncbi:MAG: hypothetical protein ABW061_10775 [Polyangiaceae bacterium]
MMFKRPLIKAGVLATLCASILATPSSANATIAEATTRLLVSVGVVRMAFPSLRDRSDWASGTLDAAQGTVYTERFERGVEYVILAVGCSNARDIDLGVVDDEGNVIAKDEKPNAEPVVHFIPEYTGRYRVGVYMASTNNGEAAHFAYQVFYLTREH